MAAMRSEQASINDRASNALGRRFNSSAHEKKNALVFYLPREFQGSPILDRLEGELESSYSSDVVFDVMEGVASNGKYYGGMLVKQPASYPDPNWCTTAFTVEDINSDPYNPDPGILTSGHCANDMIYHWDAQYTLTLEDEEWDADNDLQWHSGTSALTSTAEFWDGSGYRDVTNAAGRTSQYQEVGDIVCFYGRSSDDESCGEITDNTFAPPAGCVQACSSLYVEVKQSVDPLTCDLGDSGGPVYVATTALGVYKGQELSGTDCLRTWYKPVNGVTGIGVYIDNK